MLTGANALRLICGDRQFGDRHFLNPILSFNGCEMARVVMLTAAAGPGLNLQYGDVFETDQATADRLLELGSARKVGPDDADALVKRDAIPALPAGAKPGLEPEGVPEGEAGQPEGDQPEVPEVDATQEQKPAARRRRR